MRVLGRGVAALIRDASEAVDKADETGEPNAKPETKFNPHLTPPELRARIREQLAPVFDSPVPKLKRSISPAEHLYHLDEPIRNDLTLASFAHLHDGKLYHHDTKRMNAFRTPKTPKKEPKP